MNCFDGDQRFEEPSVREALDLDPDVPIVFCDARSRASAKHVLVSLVERVVLTRKASRPGDTGDLNDPGRTLTSRRDGRRSPSPAALRPRRPVSSRHR